MEGRLIAAKYNDARNRKTEALLHVVKAQWTKPIKSILVVGCGTGEEAGFIARRLGADTVGIDIGQEFAFDRVKSEPAKLYVMDAREMAFPDGSFDFVYSFHALEHIPQPKRALREMSRVLKPGGLYVIGTPNSSRLIGYIGSTTSAWNKIKWNCGDWMARIRGRWSNEEGAHAGFTEVELLSMCSVAFGEDPQALAAEYYRCIYGIRLVNRINRLRLASALYPCAYVMGSRRDK